MVHRNVGVGSRFDVVEAPLISSQPIQTSPPIRPIRRRSDMRSAVVADWNTSVRENVSRCWTQLGVLGRQWLRPSRPDNRDVRLAPWSLGREGASRKKKKTRDVEGGGVLWHSDFGRGASCGGVNFSSCPWSGGDEVITAQQAVQDAVAVQ